MTESRQPQHAEYLLKPGEVAVDASGNGFNYPCTVRRRWTRVEGGDLPLAYDTDEKWYVNEREVPGPIQVRIRTEDEAREAQPFDNPPDVICEHISRHADYLGSNRLTIRAVAAEKLDSYPTHIQLQIRCDKCGGHQTIEKPAMVGRLA